MDRVYKDIYHCSGCRACESICGHHAIQMETDKEGFLCPHIDASKCIDCGLCVKICPQKEVISYPLRSRNDAFGYKNRDVEVRERSTSGGAFIGIVSSIAQNTPGEYAIYGCTLEKDSDGKFRAIHSRVNNLEDCKQFQGSKYIQSDLSNCYALIADDLKAGRTVIFSGTPCQTAGVYRRFNRFPKFENLYLIDIVCHAAPSPLLFNDHVKNIGNHYSKVVTNYRFRSKVTGWGHCEQTIFSDGGETHKTRLSQNHRDLFYQNIINRPCCDICQHAGDNHFSDFTLADFWGIENIAPDFMDKKGVSLVLVNTDRAYEIITKSDNADIIEVDRQKALSFNHHAPSKVNPRRAEFWNDYHTKGYNYVLRKYAGNTPLGRLEWYGMIVVRKLLNDDVRAKIKRMLGK